MSRSETYLCAGERVEPRVGTLSPHSATAECAPAREPEVGVR